MSHYSDLAQRFLTSLGFFITFFFNWLASLDQRSGAVDGGCRGECPGLPVPNWT